MTAIEVGTDLSLLDAALEALPNNPAVFVLWPPEGEPYVSKTTLLRRRLLRLLKEREKPSRLLNLRHTVKRIEYRLTGSPFESSVLVYDLTRRHFPERYLDLLKLRMPPYVKIVLSNEFPRSQITTHLARTPGLYCGPFRSRASAERFEAGFLDLFQMRRCQEELAPSPEHPGCIYGEMAMCLRPCQLVVGPTEYGGEVARVVEFLRTEGRSLLAAIEHSRDRLSEEMRFEEAARQHKRYEKVQDVLKLRDDLARDVDRLNGVAVTRSLAPNAVEMWFVREGNWQEPQRFDFEIHEGKPLSLDRKLRETFAAVAPRKLTTRERQEYLALLARWYYSSWRDGEWLGFDGYSDIPYRKLVNAVSRVARRMEQESLPGM
ncbi:UvrB/UvrC protein [Candidatus Sulfopaludibacter sp. SbA3]|nr:UvrB/UvrC protein [Candidatus Sulfopaludibacter sp. SbA3]